MGSSYLNLVGAPPLPTTFAFRKWYFDLLEARIAETLPADDCATKYYFDYDNGSDTTGDGSMDNPWRSVFKAQAAHNSWTQDSAGLALLFRRGMTSRSNWTLSITKDYVTVGAYTDPDETDLYPAAPVISEFILKYEHAGDWASQDNHYKRTIVGALLAWTRLMDDPLTPPKRMASISAVDSDPDQFSFYVDDQGESTYVLHINFGANPSALNIEVAFANSNDGVLISGDHCRVEGARFDGFGLNPDSTSNEHYGVKVSGKGTKSAVVIDCESYYCSSKAMGYHGGSQSSDTGGFATFIDCKAGWCIYNGSGYETVFTTYVGGGEQQTVFHNCEARYGTLPSADWSDTLRGRAAYGDTLSSSYALGLAIAWGMRSTACARPAEFSGAPSASALGDARAFIVDERFEASAAAEGAIWRNGNVRLNPYWDIVAKDVSQLYGVTGSTKVSGWVVNGRIRVDLSEATSGVGLYKTATTGNSPKTLHSRIHVVGNGLTSTNGRFGIDYDMSGDTVTQNTSADAQLINSIISTEGFGGDLSGSTGGIPRLGLVNNAAKLKANAYFQLAEKTHAYKGYDKDAALVDLNALLDVSYRPSATSPLCQAGTAETRVEFDAFWQPRDPAGPTIGPVEAEYVVGDIGELLASVVTATVDEQMSRLIDGVAFESLLEAVMASLFGVATRSGDTVTFFKRNGQTGKVTVTIGTGDGERTDSTIS